MVAHLPPVIKQLLTLRNPGAFSSPPTRALNSVLHATRSEAKKHGAENGWLVLSTCTLLTANTPGAVGDLYRFATRSNPSAPETRLPLAESLDIAAKMRESSLKSSIFIGVPRTIISLAAMTEAFEEDVKDGLRKDSHRMVNAGNVDMFVERGRALWKSIYKPQDEKLYNKLGGYHPDFITFIIQAYGVVLAPFPAADQEQGNLSRALGSVVGTACLRAETRVGPQLTSHVFGLLKARNVEGLDEGDKWLSSDEGTEWVIRSVDKIYDVARGPGEEPSAKL
ncbi:hypothetical protein SCHPADRAFT_904775 [Schizopora paradoxa]|uniref:Dol-P-Man:Man(5)GlcNAc(2)-PP-Dol alpha-1,3-mannosyltransferase n=1 Tax=Schizopora paradoxa TaxID=27342 RepID=A0A0H2RTQ6_9AGAM|nr:hypothetical protein SCHPADRAFT_904775 [Schizopora paradoxa]